MIFSFRTILLKKIEPYVTFMEGLMQGLEVYNLLGQMRANPDIFKMIFCYSETMLWTYEIFIDNLKVDFAENGSNRKQSQLSCYRIFIDMCDRSYNQSKSPIFLCSFIWVKRKLILSFPGKSRHLMTSSGKWPHPEN